MFASAVALNVYRRKENVLSIRMLRERLEKVFSDYADEFEYLTNSGVALEV